MLHGYGASLLEGALLTLMVALASLAIALVLGLAGAVAKLSKVRPLRWLAQGYTTLIRGVPDLVMMLLIYLGMILLLIPGIYLAVAYLLAIPLVVERGLSPWQALEASRKAITQHWFKVFGLFLLLGLIVMVSAIPLGIGLVWSIPLMVVAMGVLYRTIFGVLPAAQ